MFKIITTKRYKSMEFNMELGDLLLELAEKVMRRQEIKIEELEEIIDIKNSDINDLFRTRQKLMNQPEKEVVNVYKLQVKPDLKKEKGIKFSGTKKELDKFIKRNSTKKAKKDHEKHHKA